MPQISGLGTTYNLPNFTGEVLRITPADTPLLSMAGFFSREGEVTQSTAFEWQTEDLTPTAAQPAILEGAAPNYQAYARANVSNVVQIFQRGFQLSYSKLAATQRLAGLAIGERNPVVDEVAQQAQAHLADIARQIEYSFLRGVYQSPSDNTQARRTRGVLTAVLEAVDTAIDALGDQASATIAANSDAVTVNGHGLKKGDVVVFASITGGAPLQANVPYFVHSVVSANAFTLAYTPGGAAIDITADGSGQVRFGKPLTASLALDMIQRVYELRGIKPEYEPTLFVSATMKRALSKAFVTGANYTETSRDVGGVNLRVLETDFGRINVVLSRFIEPHEIVLIHVGLCAPVYLEVPGKGFLFLEELAKTGAAVNYQIYGEVGLKYGEARYHGALLHVSPA